MQKTKLTRKTWARALAFILCVLMAPLCLGAVFLAVSAEEDGWYDAKETDFYDSAICRRLAYRAMSDLYFIGYNYADRDPYLYQMLEEYDADYTNFLFQITDEDGSVIAQNCDGESARLVIDTPSWYTVPRAVEVPSGDAPESADGGDGADTEDLSLKVWVRSPLTVKDEFYWGKQAFDFLYGLRSAAPFVAVASGLCALALFIFLMFAAGHPKGSEKPSKGWQEKIPLDLYLAGCVGLVALAWAVIEALSYSGGYSYTAVAFSVLAAGLACLLAEIVLLGAAMTVAARLKLGRFFYQNTLTYMVLRWAWRLFRRLWGFFVHLLRNLPLIWKTAVLSAGAMFLNLIFLLLARPYEAGGVFLILLLDAVLFAALCLGAIQLRALQKAGRELAAGNINYKVDTGKMYFDFREHAESLNRLGEGMNRAVAERMKSERFKTELITNVSHDIKTPLTSIISYVDLLKREDIPNDKTREYIEVLDRQSLRLKKLTEDLVEASKASSGALAVNPAPTDVSELLEQAVGEYADKLRQSGVEPVVSLTETPAMVFLDGRLLWRVFDNLLSNITKYAMPGTRGYISVDRAAERVSVVFRNISALPLNIPAEELQERFIRGDAARSTDGSGLGLSIARSLTELMGGHFFLSVDGDLFKAVVSFPALR